MPDVKQQRSRIPERRPPVRTPADMPDAPPRGSMRVDRNHRIVAVDSGMRKLFRMAKESAGVPCFRCLRLGGGEKPCSWCRLGETIRTRRPSSTVVDCGAAGLWRFAWRPVLEGGEVVHVVETIEQLPTPRPPVQASAETHRPHPPQPSGAPNPNYRRLFDACPDGILVADEAMRIRQANPAAAALLGYERSELVGRSLMDIEDASHPLTEAIAERAGEGRHFAACNHTLMCQPGQLIALQSSLRMGYGEGRALREVQINFRRRNTPAAARTEPLLNGADSLAQARDAEEIPERLVDWCVEALGGVAMYYRRMPETGALSLVTHAGAPEAHVAAFAALAGPNAPAGRALAHGRPVAQAAPPETLRRLGYGWLAASPIEWGGCAQAVLLAAGGEDGAGVERIETMKGLCRFAGHAVDRLEARAFVVQTSATAPRDGGAAPGEFDALSDTAHVTPEELRALAGAGEDDPAEGEAAPAGRETVRTTTHAAAFGAPPHETLAAEAGRSMIDSLAMVHELVSQAADPSAPEGDIPTPNELALCRDRIGETLAGLQALVRLQGRPGETATVDLGKLCREVAALMAPVLQRRDVTLVADVPAQPVADIATHPAELAEALTLMVSRAAECLNGGGTVELSFDPASAAIGLTAGSLSGASPFDDATPVLFDAAREGLARCGAQTAFCLDDDGLLSIDIRFDAETLKPHRAGRVWIVTDDPLVAGRLRRRVADAGFQHQDTTGADEAAEWVETIPYDTVLLDVSRRPRRALAVLNAVRRARPDAAVVAVALPGHARDNETALAAGVDDSLILPVSSADIRQALQRAARRRGTTSEESGWAEALPKTDRHDGGAVPEASFDKADQALGDAEWVGPAQAVPTPAPSEPAPEAPVDQASRLRELAARETLGTALQHEINNPLAGIIGSAELLLHEASHDESIRRRLEDIVAEGERIRDAVRRLSRPR